MGQAMAQFGTRDDGGAHLAEILVAASVIAVHVRIDQEADRLAAGNLLDRGRDLFAQGGKLAVHHEHAIGTGEHANRTTRAVERVKIIRQLVGLDLYLGIVGLRLREQGRRGQSSQREIAAWNSHDMSSIVQVSYQVTPAVHAYSQASGAMAVRPRGT